LDLSLKNTGIGILTDKSILLLGRFRTLLPPPSPFSNVYFLFPYRWDRETMVREIPDMGEAGTDRYKATYRGATL